MKQLNVLHLSSLGIWDIEKGKGRMSTYLPLKGEITHGHNVTFISCHDTVKNEDYEGIICKKINIPFSHSRAIVRLLALPLTDLIFFIDGYKLARKSKPDVIYSHCTFSVFPAYLLAKIFKSKFVIRMYGSGTSAFSKKKYPSYLLRKRCLKHKADAYILANDGTASDRLAMRFGVPKEKIHFLINGIKKDVQITRDEDLLREVAPNGEKIIIVLGRLANCKRVDMAISMMKKLNKKVKSKLLIVGDGPEMTSLESLAKDLNVSDSIFFAGSKNRQEIFRYLCISDVFLSMNEQTSMTNTTYEAMICGVPVVVRNRGTSSDLITNNINGILIDDSEIINLPNIISNLLNNETTRRRIGKNGRDYIYKNWPTWEERVEQEMNIIENL